MSIFLFHDMKFKKSILVGLFFLKRQLYMKKFRNIISILIIKIKSEDKFVGAPTNNQSMEKVALVFARKLLK